MAEMMDLSVFIPIGVSAFARRAVGLMAAASCLIAVATVVYFPANKVHNSLAQAAQASLIPKSLTGYYLPMGVCACPAVRSMEG